MNRGALWHRWDPHIHTPGTLHNDRFGGVVNWDSYIKAIEDSSPTIRAVGITDYYLLDNYRTAQKYKSAGALPDVQLLFPNVELRLGIFTNAGSALNIHLLVDPATSDHVEEAERFLRQLTFTTDGDQYSCHRDDFIRLGKRHLGADGGEPSAEAALRDGAHQFKVDLEQLRNNWNNSNWAKNNVLIAVSGHTNDGTSGLRAQGNAQDTVRWEIEKFSDIIFSSFAKSREFWVGRGAASIDQLYSIWDGPKPTLHGSDAHSVDEVGRPDKSRYCWLKGALTFDTIRQACLEPDTRAYVGDAPPQGPLPSQTIDTVEVANAPWFAPGRIALNPGLVAIIGARGSGKTALAEMIASGAYAGSSELDGNKSFVARAVDLLGDAEVELTWGSQERTNSALATSGGDAQLARVRYLSQQFVDRLCSAEGITDELLFEVQRVIFQAYPQDKRLGATSFAELLDILTSRSQEERRSNELAVAGTSERLEVEMERRDKLAELVSKREKLLVRLAKYKEDRATLLKQGDHAASHSARIEELLEAVNSRQPAIEIVERQRRALKGLSDRVVEFRNAEAKTQLDDLSFEFSDAGLQSDEWQAFLLDYTGPVDEIIRRATKSLDASHARIMGPAYSPSGDHNSEQTHLAGVELGSESIARLQAEISRLTSLLGIDKQNATRLQNISSQVSIDEAELTKLDRAIELSKSAPERIKGQQASRRESYRKVFEAIARMEGDLNDLYEPLKSRLLDQPGALGKLTFEVRRSVDIAGWAEKGEELIDLRAGETFRGRGQLAARAAEELLSVWEFGRAEDVGTAMAAFFQKYEAAFRAQALLRPGQTARQWGLRLTDWLYDTAHIRLAYSIQYDGIEIEHLSPGTRGIVLLLLYLSIDQTDDRPLIIDQPEENLDPKSVFDELVERFKETRLRRQVIVVTHNANLVVNTEADQVIVASVGNHRPGVLPTMSYVSGGLEEPEIRKHVCDILEGGAEAFKQRARRLRMGLLSISS